MTISAAADYATLLGLLITGVGFYYTIRMVRESKTAAQQTEQAVREVTAKLAVRTARNDLEAVQRIIEEIKELHRSNQWILLPARFTNVRKQLITVKETTNSLTDKQRSAIQGVVVQFRKVEQTIEAALRERRAPDDVARLTVLIADQSDKLSAVLGSIQNSTGV